MKEDRWTRLGTLLSEAVEKPPEERPSFLDHACAGDEDLRREVDDLLAAHEAAGEWLEGGTAVERPGIGSRIGAWRLLDVLGEGGMGTVYRAERADGVHRGHAALKLVKAGMDSREVLRRFTDERRILAALEHPNIARFLDGGSTEDGRPYFVMELVEGEDLVTWCRNRGSSLEDRIGLFREVCRAVDFAHRTLVVHRDLKPSNVLVDDDGVPKLLDFGIAKLLAPDPSTESTRTSLRPMTLRSSSPEQVRGEVVTTSSDVYSLGLLLYELLTDTSPYGELPASRREVEEIICEREPPRPSSVVRRTSSRAARRLVGDLDAVVLKALEKDPRRRYESAAGLEQDLGNALSARPVSARRRTLLYTVGRALERHRLPAITALLVLGTTTGFVVQLVNKQEQLDRQYRRAEAVSGFLLETFRVSDPSEGGGGSVTARELLDRGAERIRSDLETEPAVRGDLLATMGQVYENLGLYEDAAELHTHALRVRRQLHGSEHPDVAASVNDLGSVYYWQGLYEAAEEQLRQALELYRRLEGDEGEHVAAVENNLGAVLIDAWKPDEAEPLLRHALAIRSRRPDARTELIETRNNLSGLLMRLGKLEETESLQRESLEMLTRWHGGDHPQLAVELNNLATTRYNRGDIEEAGELFSRALEMQRRIYGEPHLAVSASLNNLAAIRRLEGRLEEAEGLQRRALEGDRELYGDEHPNVATHRYNLGRILRARGDLTAAEELFRQALESRRRGLGEQHPGTVRVAVDLSLLWLDTGRIAPAQQTLSRFAEAMRNAAPDVWSGAWAEAALGRCLSLQGKQQQAQTLLSSGRRRLGALLGEGHEVVLQVDGWAVENSSSSQ